MKKNIFASAVSVKNVNVNNTVLFSNDGTSDTIEIKGIRYENNRFGNSIHIQVIDLEYNIDEYSIDENGCWEPLHVCGKFTFKFTEVPADLDGIINTETVYTGQITYFEDDYKHLKTFIENGDEFSFGQKMMFDVKLNIIEKNDAYTRTVNLDYSFRLQELMD